MAVDRRAELAKLSEEARETLRLIFTVSPDIPWERIDRLFRELGADPDDLVPARGGNVEVDLWGGGGILPAPLPGKPTLRMVVRKIRGFFEEWGIEPWMIG